MSKQKRHKRRQTDKRKDCRQPVASPAPAGDDPLKALREAIADVRGRRAIALLDRLNTVKDLTESERIRLTALAREAQARELIANGHDREAREAVCAAAKRQPELVPFWSLGLRVRCGLEPDIENRIRDPEWITQLRMELVEPGDLSEVDPGGLKGEAATLLTAWRLADTGQNEAAADQLKSIGRRSPLVDWRLFVQVRMAASTGDYATVEALNARMLSGCCAHRLATAVLDHAREPARAESRSNAAPSPDPTTVRPSESAIREALHRADPVVLLRELTAYLRAVDSAAAQARVLQDARRLHALGCCQLAIGMLCACLESLRHNKRTSFLRQIKSGFPEPWRVTMRTGCHGRPAISPDEADRALRDPTLWAPKERAVILVKAAAALRDEVCAETDDSPTRSIIRQFLDEEFGGDSGWDDDDDDDEIREIRALASAAAAAWPELPDSYAVWAWADQRQAPDSCQALEARTKALPDQPDAWDALAAFAAERAQQSLFDRAIERLRAFPGTTQRCQTLRQRFQLSVIRAAFQSGDMQSVQTHSARFDGDDPFLRVAVGVMDWLSRSDRPAKQAAGVRLAELGHPWLVVLTVFELRRGLDLPAGNLPSPVRNALTDPALRASVLSDFQMYVREKGEIPKMRKDLLSALAQALGDASVPAALAAETVFLLVKHGWFTHATADQRCEMAAGVFDLSAHRIRSPDPDAQAQALMLRALLIEHGHLKFIPDVADGVQVRLLAAAKRRLQSNDLRTWLRMTMVSCSVMADEIDTIADALDQTTLDNFVAAQREGVTSLRDLVDWVGKSPSMPELPEPKPLSRPPPRRKRQNRAFIPDPPVPSSPCPSSVSAFNAFNIDRFFPTTSLEFEMGIETARRMPSAQRSATLERLRAMLDSNTTLSERSRNRLLNGCDRAQNEP